MSLENPYLDHEEKPQLHLSYCLFIDMLGFSAEIEKAFRANTEAECFEEFYSFFSSTLEQLEEERRGSIYSTLSPDQFQSFWTSKVFSDNICIGMPVKSAEGIGEFLLAIDEIGRQQLRFALEGYFIRGGWSIGNLAMDENIVWGFSLIEAHNLESRIAKYPRIVFSETMKQVIASHLQRYGNDLSYLRESPQYNQLLYSSGEIFVNYLNELIIDVDYMSTIDWESLEKHKLLIEKRLGENVNCHRILRKYIWLAAYHDAFCDGIEDHPEYSNEYKIRLRHSLKITALDGEAWRYPIIQPHVV